MLSFIPSKQDIKFKWVTIASINSLHCPDTTSFDNILSREVTTLCVLTGSVFIMH
jgi:hypothetical protein